MEMMEQVPDPILLTDVTLREYGQNVPAEGLRVFTPDVRVNIASRLMAAGLKALEIFSCVHPKVAPAMNRKDMNRIAHSLGRKEGVDFITLVPNRFGYERFLEMNLGPDGHHHTLGLFFSAHDAHNAANLGRTAAEILKDYQEIIKDGRARGIRIAAYISAVFGYFDPPTRRLLKTDLDQVSDHVRRLFGLGVETVALSDLQGVADPQETAGILEALFEKMQDVDAKRLKYHPHHVSGEKALANSLVAYRLGIRRFDASIGGTGGCVTGAPGNQPTERFVQVFEKQGVDTGLDEKKLGRLSSWIKKTLYDRIPLTSKGASGGLKPLGPG